jgi:hypothetical protein
MVVELALRNVRRGNKRAPKQAEGSPLAYAEEERG